MYAKIKIYKTVFAESQTHYKSQEIRNKTGKNKQKGRAKANGTLQRESVKQCLGGGRKLSWLLEVATNKCAIFVTKKMEGNTVTCRTRLCLRLSL